VAAFAPRWVVRSMSAPKLELLRRELKAAGAAPVVITRMLLELEEHLADAEAAAIAQGMDPGDARRHACACLGTTQAIVAAVAARTELLDWRQRWPRSARCLDTVSYMVAWPAAPFVYCASHPAGIVRWGVSSGLGACVTACMLLAMNSLLALSG